MRYARPQNFVLRGRTEKTFCGGAKEEKGSSSKGADGVTGRRAAVGGSRQFGGRGATTSATRIRDSADGDGKSTEAEMVTRATYVLVLLRLGGLERPVDPFLHVEAVLGERGDVLKRPF